MAAPRKPELPSPIDLALKNAVIAAVLAKTPAARFLVRTVYAERVTTEVNEAPDRQLDPPSHPLRGHADIAGDRTVGVEGLPPGLGLSRRDRPNYKRRKQNRHDQRSERAHSVD